MVFPTLANRIPPITLAQTTIRMVIFWDTRAEIINEDTMLADIAKNTFIVPVLNPNVDVIRVGIGEVKFVNLVGWKKFEAAKLKKTKNVPTIDKIVEILLA